MLPDTMPGNDADLLTAAEAAEYLGVTRATLYSYVSRGMLASVDLGQGSRNRGYRRAELTALRHRSTFRKDPEAAAAEVIEFGTAILTTSISQITESGHSYRDRSSSELAAEFSFEQVAEFLWTGAEPLGFGADLPSASESWQQQIDLSLAQHLPAGLTAVETLQSVLPMIEQQDHRAAANKAAVLMPLAVVILLYLTYFSTGRPYRGSIARTLSETWNVDTRKLDALLVMVADHELNIATFTARCIASAGASLHQAVLGGLGALQGYKHLYGQVSEARSFFHEVLRDGNPAEVIGRYMRQRGSVPVVHNPYRRLYSGQDPRVNTLIGLLSDSEHYPLLLETLDTAYSITGEHPRVDFALAVTEPLLGLPKNAIFNLIAIGRTAGMIAHIFEQYESPHVIRPRARYVGGGR